MQYMFPRVWFVGSLSALQKSPPLLIRLGGWHKRREARVVNGTLSLSLTVISSQLSSSRYLCIFSLSSRRLNTLHSGSACISSSSTMPVCSVNSVVRPLGSNGGHYQTGRNATIQEETNCCSLFQRLLVHVECELKHTTARLNTPLG